MKTAIITGASSGLGREFAKGIKNYFPEIEECWLIARRRERLAELAEEIEGMKCEVLALDVTTDAGMAALRERLFTKKPDVRLLINNAGCGVLKNFEESAMSCQLNMIDLNIRALTAVTHMTLNYMCSGARLMNISSIASFVPNERMAVYSASKYYVRAFSRALGMELRQRGIKVTVVCPGPMSTEFLGIAGINGNSKTFDILPRVPAEKVAAGALRAARRGRVAYTPGAFYKLYRVLGTLVPDTVMMWFART